MPVLDSLLPLIAFFVLIYEFHAEPGAGIAYYTSMALVIGLLGLGLFGGLRRGRLHWLFGVPGLAALLAIAHWTYAMPMHANSIGLLLPACLGAWAFQSIGAAIAGATKSTRVANSGILLLYLPMLAMSAYPAARQPLWMQTLAQFLPASHLVTAFQGTFFQNRNLWDHAPTMAALLLTVGAGTYLPRRYKLWVLAPFVLLGCYQAYSREYLDSNTALFRDLKRSGQFLIRNARVWTDGRVIENGAVLVRDGRIAEVYDGSAPDPARLNAELVDGTGKTLLPGLIDAHVHLGATLDGSAAALLAAGITAARSAGDSLDASIALRSLIREGARPGAQLFLCGPIFAAEGGPGILYIDHLPPDRQAAARAQLVRSPKTPELARRQVRILKAAGVDCVKTILDAGWGDARLSDRIDLLLVRAVSEEAHALHLPVATHTGDARDVADAVEIGAASIEHGSWHDEIPDRVLEHMARDGVYLDPMLGMADAAATEPERDQARANLFRAWQAGVPLVMGTDAGNPALPPGASLHHELQLWVQAGIPIPVALQAATINAARLLGAESRIGAIRKGMDADLVLVDGNPLVDIAATSRISLVVSKGERIGRSR